MAALYLGTSGWVYKHWRRVFYPEALSPAEQLPFYADRFGTVEINYSFYRLPTRGNFETWRDATPDGFIFAVKASRYLTHLRKLRAPAEPLERLLGSASGLGDKLGPLLFQFPATWPRDLGRLVEFLAHLPPNQRCAFEFRHPSWFDDQVYRALAEHEAALCLADHPDLPLAFEVTSSFTYLRLHTGRFGTGYTDPELEIWADRIVVWLDRNLDVFVYFNNDPDGWALENARHLRALIEPRVSRSQHEVH